MAFSFFGHSVCKKISLLDQKGYFPPSSLSEKLILSCNTLIVLTMFKNVNI
jgi:hypothetical protein